MKQQLSISEQARRIVCRNHENPNMDDSIHDDLLSMARKKKDLEALAYWYILTTGELTEFLQFAKDFKLPIDKYFQPLNEE